MACSLRHEYVAQVGLRVRLDRGDLVLQQRLAEARHVAVAEDAEGTLRRTWCALTVVLDIHCSAEEPNGGLSDGESHGAFGVTESSDTAFDGSSLSETIGHASLDVQW